MQNLDRYVTLFKVILIQCFITVQLVIINIDHIQYAEGTSPMLQRLVEGDTELKISLWKLADHRDSDHLNSAIRKKTNAIFLTSEKKIPLE